jgi:hypothetical protein
MRRSARISSISPIPSCGIASISPSPRKRCRARCSSSSREDSTLFGDTKELAGGNAGEFDRVKSQKGKLDLRIVEADFMRSVNP